MLSFHSFILQIDRINPSWSRKFRSVLDVQSSYLTSEVNIILKIYKNRKLLISFYSYPVENLVLERRWTPSVSSSTLLPSQWVVTRRKTKALEKFRYVCKNTKSAHYISKNIFIKDMKHKRDVGMPWELRRNTGNFIIGVTGGPDYCSQSPAGGLR